MKEIQINDLEYANLGKLYKLIKSNEASVTCNEQKVLAFSDPEWSNNVDKDEIEKLEDFILQNQDAPDEAPVITYRIEVKSMGVCESWDGTERIESLKYFRDLLKKYKALIKEQREKYEKDGYIDTSVRSDTGKTWDEFLKAFLFKRGSSGLDTQIVFEEIGVLKDVVTFVESKPIDLLLDRSTLVKLDSSSRIVLKDKSDVVLELTVNFIDLDKSIANVTPVADYKGKGVEVIAFEYVSGYLDAWLPRID